MIGTIAMSFWYGGYNEGYRNAKCEDSNEYVFEKSGLKIHCK
jgi:hypothetical protein